MMNQQAARVTAMQIATEVIETKGWSEEVAVEASLATLNRLYDNFDIFHTAQIPLDDGTSMNLNTLVYYYFAEKYPLSKAKKLTEQYFAALKENLF